MATTKKKIIVIAIVLVILLLCGTLITFYSCTKAERRHRYARARIKDISEIEVPIDSKILFHYIDNSFVNGRAEQLTVFEFESEPTDWLKENKFVRSDDETKIEDGSRTLVGERISNFWDYFNNEIYYGQKVPEEFVPNFKIPFLWVDRGIYNDYFFYYPETMRLIVYIGWS